MAKGKEEIVYSVPSIRLSGLAQAAGKPKENGRFANGNRKKKKENNNQRLPKVTRCWGGRGNLPERELTKRSPTLLLGDQKEKENYTRKG